MYANYNVTEQLWKIRVGINDAFNGENTNLVVYDETEWFQGPENQTKFTYPYSDRKTYLKKYNIDITS